MGYSVSGTAANPADHNLSAGTIAIAAIFLGLLNWIGAFHIVHCRTCHHLTGSSVNEPQLSCPHCRHPALTHPLYAARHPQHRVHVLADPLRY